MPCPEQRTWGGVTKRRRLWLLEHPRITWAATPLLAVVQRYLPLRYARDAHGVADEAEDYILSDLLVHAAVGGWPGRPAAGVRTTLDVGAAALRIR
jgi:hypothetical protein